MWQFTGDVKSAHRVNIFVAFVSALMEVVGVGIRFCLNRKKKSCENCVGYKWCLMCATKGRYGFSICERYKEARQDNDEAGNSAPNTASPT